MVHHVILRSVVVVAALASALPPAATEPVKIRMAWAQTPGQLTPLEDELVKLHPEIFPHAGTSYVAQAVRFAGGTAEIQAVAAGELELASVGAAAFALAVTNAHQDLRIVCSLFQDGFDGYYTSAYWVRKDGPIKTIEDIKGRTVAVNARGSTSDTTMRVMFRRHGIADKDFTTIEANFPNMPAMIEDDKVDLITSLPQFAGELDRSGKYRLLFTARETHRGPTEGVQWAAPAAFIAAHRAALVDFFEDHIRAVRWFIDPAHHDEAVGIAQQATKIPRAQLEYAFTKKDYYRAPDLRSDVVALQRDIDEAVLVGVLQKRLVVSPDYVDLSLVDEALRRIGGNEAPTLPPAR